MSVDATRSLTCAICETPLPDGAAETVLFPFCSQRCKLIDLGRWFDGDYAVVSRASIEDIEDEMERQASNPDRAATDESWDY